MFILHSFNEVGVVSVHFLTLLLPTLLIACEYFEKKSTHVVPGEDHGNPDWWSWQWVTHTHQETLYTYTICKNTNLEIGKELEIEGNKDNLKYIMFQNSTITTIPVGVFNSFTTLTEIYLNASEISTIHPGAFSGLINLEELYLQDNQIQVLERGVLNYLTKLKILDLSRNRLRQLEENSLLGLLKLETILLNQNSLIQTSLIQLNSIKLIKLVDLSNNHLSNLNGTSLQNISRLEVLLLNNNSLEGNLTTEIFNEALEVLDVSWNKLNGINFEGFSSNSSSRNGSTSGVKYLKLCWNRITSLNWLEIFNGLIELDLGFNLIQELQPDIFLNLTHLKVLNLNNNKILFLPIGCFKNLTSLTVLDLSENLLTGLEFGTFTGLGNLEKLSLANNQIKLIHENSFHVFENLKKLYLENNFLKILKLEDILEHTTNLEFVDLNGNNWDCNSLFNSIKLLRKVSVEFPHGNEFKTQNVYGIACTSQPQETTCMDTYKNAPQAHENLNFYQFFNENLVNTEIFGYLKTKFTRLFDTKNENDSALVRKSSAYGVVEVLHDFINRVTTFLTIMCTIFIVILFLFVLLFVKPKPKPEVVYRNLNENADFPPINFEMR